MEATGDSSDQFYDRIAEITDQTNAMDSTAKEQLRTDLNGEVKQADRDLRQSIQAPQSTLF